MMKITGFDDCFTILLGNEGDYSNNPRDPGGETRFGTTKRVALAYGYSGPMQELPLETAKSIAKTQYWDKYHCDQFDPRIGLQLFDAAYNGGHPVEWLQTAVGVTPDGIIGAGTIGAVRAADPIVVASSISCQRLLYLAGIPGWSEFGKGWTRRIANNLLRSL